MTGARGLRKLAGRGKRKVASIAFDLQRRFVPKVRRKYYLESLVGPIGFWEQLRRYQFEFLCNAGLKPHHTLLDIGCGPLQGGIPLIEYLDKQHYVGIDMRPEALNVAHELIAEHRLASKNPIILHSESFGRTELPDHTFDYIWASQVLYHLSPPLLDQLLAQIKRFSNAQTVFHGDVFVLDPAHSTWYKQGTKWSGYHYHFHTRESVAALAAEHGLAVEELGSLEQHGYPKEISLRTNRMLRITPVQPAV